MDRKYRIEANDPVNTLKVTPEMHHALKTISRELRCSMQEVTYRFLLRGLAWYVFVVKPKTGEARTAAWWSTPAREYEQRKRAAYERKQRRTRQPFRPVRPKSPDDSPDITEG